MYYIKTQNPVASKNTILFHFVIYCSNTRIIPHTIYNIIQQYTTHNIQHTIHHINIHPPVNASRNIILFPNNSLSAVLMVYLVLWSLILKTADTIFITEIYADHHDISLSIVKIKKTLSSISLPDTIVTIASVSFPIVCVMRDHIFHASHPTARAPVVFHQKTELVDTYTLPTMYSASRVEKRHGYVTDITDMSRICHRYVTDMSM